MAKPRINIVYPINGGTYPRANPLGKLKSAYITLSFGVTAGGGPVRVTWGVDGKKLGAASCYDQLSEQQVWKLPGGKHKFWVKANIGGVASSKTVNFKVGS